jgi:hypothetical protein
LPVAPFCPNFAGNDTSTRFPKFVIRLRIFANELRNRSSKEKLPMDIVPLGPGFAAELRGATLSDIASDDAAYAAARAAFEEHSVLVFRDQDVTDEISSPFHAASGRRR